MFKTFLIVAMLAIANVLADTYYSEEYPQEYFKRFQRAPMRFGKREMLLPEEEDMPSLYLVKRAPMR